MTRGAGGIHGFALGVVLAAGLPSAAPANPGNGLIGAVPPSALDGSLAAGTTSFSNGAIAYRPAQLPDRPASVLVLLHGAGEPAGAIIGQLRQQADRFGLVLLAVQSAEPTWDLVASLAASGDPIGLKQRRPPRFGRDPQRIDRAMAQLFGLIAVDRSRIAIAGFSDGASTALSIGLANPQLFSGVIAMSPGLVLLPPTGVMRQRIVITHGRQDRVLPFAVSKRDIAGLIERAGYRPWFIAFDGNHRIDHSSLEQGLAILFPGADGHHALNPNPPPAH